MLLSQEEMSQNKRLTERLAKDLNADQTLPYQDGQFDAVRDLIAQKAAWTVPTSCCATSRMRATTRGP